MTRARREVKNAGDVDHVSRWTPPRAPRYEAGHVPSTWILLRGLARETGHYGDFVPLARRLLPEANVVPLDFPGTGSRLHEPTPRTIGDLVERLREEARERVDTSVPLFVFGMSMGGMVAMEWADRHPSELSGIVVVASSAGNLSHPLRRFSLRGVAAVARNRLLTKDPFEREARMVRLLMHTRDRYEESVKLWGEIARDRPLTDLAMRTQVRAAAEWRAPAKLNVPALFLVGARDKLVDPSCTIALARHFKTHALIHPDAGHDLTTDAGPWCIDQMKDFESKVLAARLDSWS